MRGQSSLEKKFLGRCLGGDSPCVIMARTRRGRVDRFIHRKIRYVGVYNMLKKALYPHPHLGREKEGGGRRSMSGYGFE